VIGYVLIQIFAIDLHWLPVQVLRVSRRSRPVSRAHHPADLHAVLHLCGADRAHDAGRCWTLLGEDYVRTGAAKGLGESAVLLRHACARAVPVITVIGTGFALLISGVVVTESVFNLRASDASPSMRAGARHR